MLVICILEKPTASKTYLEGETYDVRSSDAQRGIDGIKATKGNKGIKPFFKPASKADSDKYYDAKQKKAFNAAQIAEIQKAEKKAE